MSNDLYPLLAPFFREGRGTVYYKAYPPYRGDDVQSVIELARILPPGVSFVPIPPRIPHVGDLRHLLKALLDSALKNSRRGRAENAPPAELSGPDVSSGDGGRYPDAETGLPGVAASESPNIWPPPVSDVMPDETSDAAVIKLDQEIEQSVLELVKECLPADLRGQAARLVDEIRNEPLYPALREIVSATIYGGVDDLSFAPIVPDEGPVLVIGRPELFHHDVPLESLQSPHALSNILKDAGYPNRFDFLSESDDVRFNTRGVRDRKTNAQYLRKERFKDDVGFVCVNRLADGRTVTVAAGTTAFGTYAAVKLLTESRPAFAAAMARHQELRGPAAIDIAFRCRHHRATQPMVFPFAQPSQHLTIVPLNPNDMVGFRWNRRSHELFAPLLEWWSPHEPLDGRPEKFEGSSGDVRWSWEPRPANPREKAARVVVNVAVEAPAFRAGNHTIVCGRRMAAMLTALKQQLADDMKDWLSRVRRRRERPSPHDTFRPMLLVGETGTGKTIIAEAISEVWPGTTLDDSRHQRGDEGIAADDDRKRPNALLDAAARALGRKLAAWPELSGVRAPRIITFSVSAFPSTMLEKELFGCSSRYANDTAAACGVFLQSGTGILFLDELLELPTEQLTRLLVALQKGSVRPLGAEKDFEFYCRLIAATNRASSIDDLDRLAALGELNPAIVARFKQRYEVLPLRERPEEIIPQLIHFIQLRIARDITPDRGGAMPEEICVRISRPALDTLLGHDFPENVRELERFVNSLPRDLVASFCARWAPNPGEDRTELARNASAIRLCHLNVLKPRAPGVEEENRIRGEARGIDEREFYQFTLTLRVQDLAPPRDKWFDGPETSQAATSLPLQSPAPVVPGSPSTSERRVDVPHESPAPVATRPTVRVAVPIRIGTAERADCMQALATLRRDPKARWVDALFGISDAAPDGDFALFDAVFERLESGFTGFDSLPALFEDEVFSTLLKASCDQILERMDAMSDEPFDVAMLKSLQKNRDWWVVRRRLPLARLAVPLEMAANDADYEAACKQKRAKLRSGHQRLNKAFVAWNRKHYGSGGAAELLSILLGEDFASLH